MPPRHGGTKDWFAGLQGLPMVESTAAWTVLELPSTRAYEAWFSGLALALELRIARPRPNSASPPAASRVATPQPRH